MHFWSDFAVNMHNSNTMSDEFAVNMHNSNTMSDEFALIFTFSYYWILYGLGMVPLRKASNYNKCDFYSRRTIFATW